ncbi:MAG: hypothetical protein KDK91_00445 [Gammaproteobacteria bacterium]|nr:hypothetical protein [Gammaproteobacteria bacterium]
MSTRTRLNLVLGVVLATLLTALWLWPAAPAPETQTRVPLPVDTSVETVARIEIQRPAAAPVQLSRRSDGWWLTRPFEYPANATHIARLLSILDVPARPLEPASRTTSISMRDRGDESAPVADDPLGLDPPALARLGFDDIVLDLGARTPLGLQRYVRLGDRLYVIEDRWRTLLQGPLQQFCSSELLGDMRGLSAASLHAPDTTDANTDDRGSALPAAKLTELEARLRAAKAFTVRAAGEVRAAPLARLRLTNAQGSTLLTLRSTGQSLVVERDNPPLAHHFTATAGQELIDDLNALFFARSPSGQ